MSSNRRVALVTGGNKGIGFAIVRGLCRELGDDGVVYLTARNEKLGQEAVRKLKEEKLRPEFLQLDISDHRSIEKARDEIVKKHGGLDILINNAAIAFKEPLKLTLDIDGLGVIAYDATEPFGEQAEMTIATNFTATLDVCDVLLPILRPHARVVNISSTEGNVNKITNTAIRQRITSSDLTLEELKKIMVDFVEAAKRNAHRDLGFPSSAYGMSKTGRTALTYLQQRQFDQDPSRPDIVANAADPGYVDTDMSSHKGPKTIDEGAKSAIYAALLPTQPPECESNVPRGQYIDENCQVHDWRKGF